MRRNWLIAVLAIVAAAVVVAMLVMRSSDDGSDDLETWAGAVCTSVADWRTSVLALADIGGGLNAESLRERIDEAESATEELVSDLRDLGAPDVDSGDELQEELEATVTGLESEYDALRADAQEALDATTPTAFLQALASLAPRFQSLLEGAATFLEELERAPDVAAETRAELTAAFDDAEPCRELREAQ
ncbi:MAG TPA: hypothetical protein VMN35_08730 [Gaiellaceae bacterium]|nr:hypothetical protein [Gaiellaceae bacterium]